MLCVTRNRFVAGLTARPVAARDGGDRPRDTMGARRARLRAVVEPVVVAAGYDLEDLTVSRAGRRHVVRVVVDGDTGTLAIHRPGARESLRWFSAAPATDDIVWKGFLSLPLTGAKPTETNVAAALAGCGDGLKGYTVPTSPLVVTTGAIQEAPNGPDTNSLFESADRVDFEVELSGGCGGPYVMSVISGILPDGIGRLEIVNGAGTLLYGSDALAGTINIVTNEPTFSERRRFLYGFDGYFSSNEDGGRGTVTLGVTAPRYAIRFQGGAEDYEDYRSGNIDVEDTRPLFASGQLRQVDAIRPAGSHGDRFHEFVGHRMA